MYSQTPENSAGARSGVAPNSPVSVPDAVPGTRPKAALADSEARLRLAQEAAGIGLWEYDFASGMMDWSSGQYRLYGLDPAAGPPGFSQWIGLVEPEDRDAILEAERVCAWNSASAARRTALSAGSPAWAAW